MQNPSLLDLSRVWAMITGLILAAWYFGALYLGAGTPKTLSMLITGVGGFELLLFVQDIVLKRKGRSES